jgi:hypothetical protein
MPNSVETILKDIKGLIKELEISYGNEKPFTCDVTGVEPCPNKKCWVQRVNDKYLDKICSLEILLKDAEKALHDVLKHDTTMSAPAKKNIVTILSRIDQELNSDQTKSEDNPDIAVRF